MALAPSQVNSLGSAPPSFTSELLRMNVQFDDVIADSVDSVTVESGGGDDRSPGANEQPANNRKMIKSVEIILMFILFWPSHS